MTFIVFSVVLTFYGVLMFWLGKVHERLQHPDLSEGIIMPSSETVMPMLEAVEALADKHLPGVVSVMDDLDDTGRPVITVLIEKGQPIPAGLPSSFGGYPVRHEFSGKIVPYDNPAMDEHRVKTDEELLPYIQGSPFHASMPPEEPEEYPAYFKWYNSNKKD